ncbi:MAG: hypothetical protein HY567_03175 [Candidatus Kerfeldbacteria bacterium]|nr:hypothetical protein [Candidatus Kerfeldbacteria bacterium]
MFKVFRKFFGKRQIEPEALLAYFYRLPEKIEVSWEKDGQYIIGRIKTDDKEFLTQGVDSDDFIEMVNDAVYSAYEIPNDYIEVVSQLRPYFPKPEEKEKLESVAVTRSRFSTHKAIPQRA